jgi:hypothetical protein
VDGRRAMGDGRWARGEGSPRYVDMEGRRRDTAEGGPPRASGTDLMLRAAAQDHD